MRPFEFLALDTIILRLRLRVVDTEANDYQVWLYNIFESFQKIPLGSSGKPGNAKIQDLKILRRIAPSQFLLEQF